MKRADEGEVVDDDDAVEAVASGGGTQSKKKRRRKKKKQPVGDDVETCPDGEDKGGENKETTSGARK